MITIGSDPEFFLKSGGEFKSSIGLIGGSKEHPAPLEKPGFFIQEDNVAVEFNVPPASTVEEFVRGIEWSITHIGNKLAEHGITMSFDASALFDPKELQHPMAKVFGCDPDFNAWKDGAVNPRPACAEANLRTAGGHVHVGYPEVEIKEFRLRLMQAADLWLGIPSVLEDRDKRRALLYGKAGAFRPTSYGAEYRVLSNFWLREPRFVRWVYDGMQRAYSFVKKPKNIQFLDQHSEEIQQIINGREITDAVGFMAAFKIPAIR